MKPLEIAKLLGIKHQNTPPGTKEVVGWECEIERLYWAGFHDGKQYDERGLQEQAVWPRTHTTFALGDLVSKRRGSSWRGRVVGWYSTQLTPEGYAVESDHELGSVQIYPAAALQKWEAFARMPDNEDPMA